MKMVSELCEFLMCMHHVIGYFDIVTVLNHPTHACIVVCSDVCLTLYVELTISHNNLITFV